MKIGKYSFGVGDRFSLEGKAQLAALIKAHSQGVEITPVWNKSNREHEIVHSEPKDTRLEADEAVKSLGWNDPYFVDADHINLSNVDRFIDYSDFFTLDVAMNIGTVSPVSEIDFFKKSCEEFGKEVTISGISEPIRVSDELLNDVSRKYLAAIKEAGKIYRHIEAAKGRGNFITEISMDEVDEPQSPVEMFFILKMIANEKIPAQTIAPKFTGRFNKGVDYLGNVNQFAVEFEQNIHVIDYAVKRFGLPQDLKLSVHSGSDKFTIYPIMAEIIRKYDKGLHVKTAGTTWLEEVIGLAISGHEGLEVAKEIYSKALARKCELCAPYADVINIDDELLPSVEEVDEWSSEKFGNTLRHIPNHPDYNSNFRQLIHVGYKIASEMGEKYISLLTKNSDVIGECVEQNIYDRHLKRLFDLHKN